MVQMAPRTGPEGSTNGTDGPAAGSHPAPQCVFERAFGSNDNW